jgi:hypothetical protein
MLDLAGILFSSAMMLFVIIRAIQLDGSQPWFQAIPRRDDTTPATPRPWHRRS